jgi:hypothetical protein
MSLPTLTYDPAPTLEEKKNVNFESMEPGNFLAYTSTYNGGMNIIVENRKLGSEIANLYRVLYISFCANLKKKNFRVNIYIRHKRAEADIYITYLINANNTYAIRIPIDINSLLQSWLTRVAKKSRLSSNINKDIKC